MMATPAENIQAAIDAIAAAIAANPLAISYSIDGQSVDRSLLVKKLADLQAIQASLSGPLEIESRAVI